MKDTDITVKDVVDEIEKLLNSHNIYVSLETYRELCKIIDSLMVEV